MTLLLAPPDPPLADGPARLRALEDRDVPDFVRGLQDEAVSEKAYGRHLPADQEVVQVYVENFRVKAAAGEGILLAIADDGDAMAGLGMLFAIKERNLDAEIGFWLGPWARGRGIGTVGVRLLCAWAFGQVGLERVHAITSFDNEPTRALLERAGFILDGTLRGSERTAAGERRDQVTYSMLSSDEGAPR